MNGLPANEDTEISFEKPGHSKVLRLAHTGSAPINLMQTRLTTEGGRQKLLEKVGRSQDPALALMVAVAITPAEGIGGLVLPDGVVTTLEPGGPGPIYSLGSASPGGLSSDELDPELTATREGGWAVFLDIEPGEYALRFERNGRLCTIALPGFGYGANLDGSIRVKTFAGYATMGIAALCQ